MTDILFATGENNPGGNFLIRFVPVVGVSLLPAPATSGPSTAPTFVGDFQWYNCYGTEGSKTVEESQEPNDNGPIWTVKIVTFVPSDSAQLRQLLAMLVRHRFIVEVEDNTGLIRRLGTLTEYLSLSYNFKTGGEMGERRGATLTWSGQLSAPAPVVYYS